MANTKSNGEYSLAPSQVQRSLAPSPQPICGTDVCPVRVTGSKTNDSRCGALRFWGSWPEPLPLWGKKNTPRRPTVGVQEITIDRSMHVQCVVLHFFRCMPSSPTWPVERSTGQSNWAFEDPDHDRENDQDTFIIKSFKQTHIKRLKARSGGNKKKHEFAEFPSTLLKTGV